MNREQSTLVGRLAASVRHRPDDTSTADDIRRQLKEARLAEHIQRIVNEAPPLTADQRHRLATLLRPTPAPRPGATPQREQAA